MRAQLISLLLDLFTPSRRRDPPKDRAILLLRQPLRIRQRPHPGTPRLSRGEKLGLAVLAAKFRGLGRGAKTKLDQALLLFTPDTMLRWHRDLMRRQCSVAGARPT